MKNIYVGNLDFNSTEDELRLAFEAFGHVNKVTIVTDRDTGQKRGFGFVEMADDTEGMNAIAGLAGATLGGRALMVNEARPKREAAGFGGRRGGRGRY